MKEMVFDKNDHATDSCIAFAIASVDFNHVRNFVKAFEMSLFYTGDFDVSDKLTQLENVRLNAPLRTFHLRILSW